MPSPYDGLRQWESDEDLIQLDSPELISYDVVFKHNAQTYSLEASRGMSKEGGV